MFRVLLFSATLALTAAFLSSCAASTRLDSGGAGAAVDTPVADVSVGVD